MSELIIYYKLYKSSGAQLYRIKKSISENFFKYRKQKNTITLMGQVVVFLSEIFFTLIGGIMVSLGKTFPGHRSKYLIYHTYIMSHSIGSIAMFLSSHELRRFYFRTDNINDLTIFKTLKKVSVWLPGKYK